MDSITTKIDGLEDLERRLIGMGQVAAAKAIVGGAFNVNRLTVNAIQAQLESNGSIDTGLLKDSIKRKKIVYDKSGTVVIITGVSKSVKGVDSRGKPRVPWRYAHVVESKKPFMKQGFDSVKQQVIDEFIIYLLKKIKRFEKGVKK